MVSAMTSYSSWRHGAFLFLGNIRLKAISNSINAQSIHEELSFHRLQNNVYYRWISSHFSCKQNSKHKNAELSILAGEDMTPKNPLDICANIAVTKHVLLADEFVPYRPRLLSFHSLHVNAMKCIYVGFSLSKLLSFFWKISLNSRSIRLEGFNNNISTISFVCSVA